MAADSSKVSTKGFDKLEKAVKAIRDLDVQVGWVGEFGKVTYEDGQTVASIGFLMEFGTDTMPPRGTLRKTFTEDLSTINKIWKDNLTKILSFKVDPEQGYENIAKEIAKLVLATFDRASSWSASLDDSTVKLKGSNQPLVRTGKLRENISWAVTRKGNIIKSGKVV